MMDEIIEILFKDTITDIFSIKSVVEVAVEKFGTVVKYLEARKMFKCIEEAFKCTVTPEEFRDWFNNYCDKMHFIEFIEKQRRSNHYLINMICGAVAKEAFKENRKLNTIELNHIECLLSMNLNDIHNCAGISKRLKDNIGEERQKFLEKSKLEHLECCETTRQKLAQNGYIETDTYGYAGGGIPVSDMFFNLMEYVSPIYELYTTYHKESV